MDLGNFSISLAVKDIEASKRFYEKFGFKVFMGNASQNWLILKNGHHVIGLFQGMFEKNIHQCWGTFESSTGGGFCGPPSSGISRSSSMTSGLAWRMMSSAESPSAPS